MAKKKPVMEVISETGVTLMESNLVDEKPCICLDDNQKAFMKAVIEATNKGDFIHVGMAFAAPLLDAGLILINTDFTNEAGEIASRATQKGIEFMSEVTPPDNGVKAPEELPTHNSLGIKIFRIPREDIDKVRKVKKSGRVKRFPFDEMEVGTTIFMPGIDAAKKYTSTVSSANQRFAVVVPGEFREKKTLLKYETDVFPADGSGGPYHKGDPILDEAGKKTYKVEQVPKTAPTRNYIIYEVTDGAAWEHPGEVGAVIERKA